jgi:hypothetical protein
MSKALSVIIVALGVCHVVMGVASSCGLPNFCRPASNLTYCSSIPGPYCYNPANQNINPMIIDTLIGSSSALNQSSITSFDSSVKSGTIRNTTECRAFFVFQQCAASFNLYTPSCINDTFTAPVSRYSLLSSPCK